MKKPLKSLFETGVLHLVVLCLIFALALVVSGCSVTKVNYERDEKGVVSYRLYRNDHWLKTSGTGISGGMTKDGKFEFSAEGLERSPSEEFNRTMMTYTSAFIQLAQIAAAAYNPSASMAAAKSESSKAGSSTIVLEAPKTETQPDQVVAPKAETQPDQGWIMLTGSQSSTGNNAASDPHAAECTDGSCTTGACTDGSCNR
jgi:hypothetical protein